MRRKTNHPKALIAGAVTALDLCARQLLLKNMCSQQTVNADGHLDCIRTGSTSIDQLLAPDSTYSTFDNGWSMPYPYKIPINNDESASSFDHTTTKNAEHHATTAQGKAHWAILPALAQISTNPATRFGFSGNLKN